MCREAFWITGFTNAQGFLTGMRQEVTRQHKKDAWALDDVISHTDVCLGLGAWTLSFVERGFKPF